MPPASSWAAKSVRFAARWSLTAGKIAHVYAVTAQPEAVLADMYAIEGDGGRPEAEIVVDPTVLGPLNLL